LGLGLGSGLMEVATAAPREVSGVYPHLAMFNDEAECGTGAVVPWAGRLWVVTYAPHRPEGSTDKLYEIGEGLEQVIRPESIGGTPANRMIHRESNQLFIGPYVIGAGGRVRAIPYGRMYGRPTGTARHLGDPAGKVVYATMEEGFYEVDVDTLEVTELWADEQRESGRHADLPGYHGKGFYSAEGRYVYANNGEHGAEALRRPDVPSGCLAEWDGEADRWTVVRRNQFTEVTGPGGIEGQADGDGRIWSIGWDHRSLILMLREAGGWHSYRLPKASHCYDGAHGWNTEWPRIRDIGEEAWLMTMHGSFWRFPRTFSVANTRGIAPRSTYLKVVGDFCRWGDRVVLGCDDTARSEFLNQHPLKGDLAGPGRSQSNLWFVEPSRLDEWGPVLGRGAVWLSDDVRAGEASEPYLLNGFAERSLYLAHEADQAASFDVEVDRRGDGTWQRIDRLMVPARSGLWWEISKDRVGVWLRLVPDVDVVRATAFFHYRGRDHRGEQASGIFGGLATCDEGGMTGGVLHVGGGEDPTLRFMARGEGGGLGSYDLDGELRLRRAEDAEGAAWTAAAVAIQEPLVFLEGGAVVYADEAGRRWRLPRGDAALDQPGPLGWGRLCREVCTERNLVNLHGTFYEMPAENAGGFRRIRPIATHNRRIHDFASYRGLLVMSGVRHEASGDRIVRSVDGRCALWVGVVDDLWSLVKPRGELGVWTGAAVQSGEISDACLATGYDRKRLVISHQGPGQMAFRIEADFVGDGVWREFVRVQAGPGEPTPYRFPDAFGAYWIRLVAEGDGVVTAALVYDCGPEVERAESSGSRTWKSGATAVGPDGGAVRRAAWRECKASRVRPLGDTIGSIERRGVGRDG